MTKRVGVWIQMHLLLIEMIFIILTFIASLFMGFTNRYQELMITLLVFIGSEFILLIIGYLEPIMRYIRQENRFRQTRTGKEDLKSIIKTAKKNVVIIGSTLSSLLPLTAEINNLSSDITVELFYIDPEFLSANDGFCDLINRADINQFQTEHDFFMTKIYSLLKQRSNTLFYKMSFASPITYIAIDTANHSGQILAEHYMRGEADDLAFLVKPGCELYDIYRQQIDFIREASQNN